ncbi:hypothetical protein H4R33_005399 [Dimargaris cristalligena]|nr:hypothetical protein H4R33_005399 [Dimargaris cristalligena]
MGADIEEREGFTSLYLRVKRNRDTVFVLAQPTTTVTQIKQQVREALGADLVNENGTNLRLGISSTPGTTGNAPPSGTLMDQARNIQWLDDPAQTVQNLHLTNAQMIFASIQTSEGGWEPIDIPEPSPVDDDEDDVEDMYN